MTDTTGKQWRLPGLLATLTAERDAAVKRAEEAEARILRLREIEYFASRATAAEERVRVLAEHVRELSDELGSEIEAKYATTTDYPSERRRYERDIAPVVAARNALSMKGAGDE